MPALAVALLLGIFDRDGPNNDRKGSRALDLEPSTPARAARYDWGTLAIVVE
jgi:hypothetical protein